jgi:very-short-patch-repair endonuclease
MPVLQVFKHEYEDEMLEIRFQGIAASLFITPEHRIATPAESLPNFKARVGMARTLRKESTPAESKLWSLVRGKRYGVKVRRQHPMGPFVLDFYIPDVRLAIEVDGSIHELEQQKEYDRFREEMIQNHDIEFLRFSNEDIYSKTSMVLLSIADRINARKTQFDYRVHWRTAGELKVGRVVLAAGMAEQRIITFIGNIQTRETVYNLSVAEDHTYVTEFCTLHN